MMRIGVNVERPTRRCEVIFRRSSPSFLAILHAALHYASARSRTDIFPFEVPHTGHRLLHATTSDIFSPLPLHTSPYFLVTPDSPLHY